MSVCSGAIKTLTHTYQKNREWRRETEAHILFHTTLYYGSVGHLPSPFGYPDSTHRQQNKNTCIWCKVCRFSKWKQQKKLKYSEKPVLHRISCTCSRSGSMKWILNGFIEKVHFRTSSQVLNSWQYFYLSEGFKGSLKRETKKKMHI